MNDTLQRQIELLIDGELSPDEEAKLLRRIDGDCDAWKQLGMTFLEDRLFRHSLSLSGPAVAPAAARMEPPAPGRRGRFARMAAAAIVACVAFVGGRMSVTTEPADDSILIAENESNESGAPATETAGPSAVDRPEADGAFPEATEFVSMQLVGRDDVPLQEMYVPLWDADRYREQVASTNAAVGKPLVDEQVRRLLAERGRTVDERLTLVPIRLEDGRTGVIPITNIEVRAARLPAIQ